MPLGELFRAVIELGQERELRDDELPVYRQRSFWFFGAALLFLALEMLLVERRWGVAQGRQADEEKDRQEEALSPRLLVGLSPCLLLLIAGSPSPRKAFFRGNEAFHRGAYDEAARLYEEAEGAFPDPGRLAYNWGVALYRQGAYREAEHQFRCSREDAEGERLARVLYGLGNCLVQQAQERRASLLEQAVAAYEACLRLEIRDAGLREDVRHNLELTKVLLIKARAAGDEQANPPGPEAGGIDPQDDGQSQAAPPGNDPGLATPDPRGQPETVGGPQRDAAQARETDRPPPGRGELPPLPDADELTALSPEDAAAHFRREVARIREEQRQYQRQQVKAPAAHVRDW